MVANIGGKEYNVDDLVVSLAVDIADADSGTELVFNHDTGRFDIPNTPFSNSIEEVLTNSSIFNIEFPEDEENYVAVNTGTEYVKIIDAVAKDLGNDKFIYGDKYLFFVTKENRWAKATMEQTSSDLGRVMSGFAIPLDSTNKKKYNRLTKLNIVYNLGLDKDTIKEVCGR